MWEDGFGGLGEGVCGVFPELEVFPEFLEDGKGEVSEVTEGGMLGALDGGVDLTALVGHFLLVVDVFEVANGGVFEGDVEYLSIEVVLRPSLYILYFSIREIIDNIVLRIYYSQVRRRRFHSLSRIQRPAYVE